MKSGSKTDLYRKLPSVDELLRTPVIANLISREGPAAVTESARAVLSRLRQEIGTALVDDESLDLALSGIPSAIERELQQALRYSLRTVINATGVILHTNLGRAPLSHAAIDHIREIAGAYSNLEFDTETGERGKRDIHVDRLFQKLLSEKTAELRSAGRAGTPGKIQRHLARSGYYESHSHLGLRARPQREDSADFARAPLEFPDHRIYRAASN